MAAMAGAVAVAVALIGSLTSKKKSSKRSMQQLSIPVVGILSAGFALYFGWKHCRTRLCPPLPKKTTPNNSQPTTKEEVEEAEVEIDKGLSSHEDQNISQVINSDKMNNNYCSQSQTNCEQKQQSQWTTASQCSTSFVLNNNEESIEETLSSDPEAMPRPLEILREGEIVDLLGDTLPTSPSLSPTSSVYCYSSSSRHEWKEERTLRPVDGRFHAYDEYLSDPCLSPRMRAQVLKAKSIVERIYRSHEQSSISQENSIVFGSVLDY